MDGTSVGATNVTVASLTTDDLTAGEEVDARLWYVDSESGHVWQRVTLEGDDPVVDEWQDAGLLVPPGAGGGGVGDGLDPPDVTGLDCQSVYQQQSDGTSLPVIVCTWTGVSAPDLIGYELQWQSGAWVSDPASPSSPPTYEGPDWLAPGNRRVGKDDTVAVLEPVVGGRTYDVRIRAYDAESRVGDYATDSPVVIVPDNDAPAIPEPTTYAGFELIGVRWERNREPDFDHYEVRYRTKAVTGPPAVPVGEYIYEETRATVIVLGDLVPGTVYQVNVRSVDASGNVRVPGNPEAVPPVPDTAMRPDNVAYIDTGWSPDTPASENTPTLIGESSIAFENVIIGDILTANFIHAKYVSTGALAVGGGGAPVSLRVYDSTDKPIGAWGDFGWLVADQRSTKRAIWATPMGELKFTNDYVWNGLETFWAAATPGLPSEQHIGTVKVGIEQGLIDTPATNWTTALDPDGIHAEAILLGAIGGGSNRVLNAGFELITPATAALGSKTWDLTTDWDDAASPINLSTTTGDLKMTAV